MNGPFETDLPPPLAPTFYPRIRLSRCLACPPNPHLPGNIWGSAAAGPVCLHTEVLVFPSFPRRCLRSRNGQIATNGISGSGVQWL